MAEQSGVWVDAKKAIVIKIKDEDNTFKVIDSGIETREREEGEGKKFGRFAKQFVSFEKSKQRRISEQEKKYFKNILKEIENSDDLVLFGPANVKHRLEKELHSHKGFKVNILGVEDADSMTDNQITAWVKKYYTQ